MPEFEFEKNTEPIIVNEIIKNINDTVDEKKDIAPEIEWDDDSI